MNDDLAGLTAINKEVRSYQVLMEKIKKKFCFPETEMCLMGFAP